MKAPHIDSYRPGLIIIDGQEHDRDVIILPDRVLGGWWRQAGHLLHPADLKPVFEAAPQTLIVGQGVPGRMQVPRETQQALQTAGIRLVTLPTDQACQTYNALREENTTAAALHLTC
jgi:hypothetical protein